VHNCLGDKVVSARRPGCATDQNSYARFDDKENFATVHDRMVAAKAEIMKRQMDLLEERYDLSNHPATGVVMDRTKQVQDRVRRLAALTDAISAGSSSMRRLTGARRS
jgi:hypothetical protein